MPSMANPTPTTIALSEDVYTLSVIFHVIYNASFKPYTPTLEALSNAINALDKYGLRPCSHVSPGSPIFEEVVKFTSRVPLIIYTLGAEHDLFEIAQKASEHLLTYPVSTLSDDIVARVGSVYLQRLFDLHAARIYVLQRLVTQRPDEHKPNTHRGENGCESMQLAWSNAAAILILDVNPGLFFHCRIFLSYSIIL